MNKEDTKQLTVLEFWQQPRFLEILKKHEVALHERTIERMLGFAGGCRCDRCALPGVTWEHSDGFLFPSTKPLTDKEVQERRVAALRGMAAVEACAKMKDAKHSVRQLALGKALVDILNPPYGMHYDHLERLFLMFLGGNGLLPCAGRALYLSELYCAFLRDPWLLFVVQWVQSGRPSLRLDGKLAASLMLTDYPVDLLSSLQAPWPAFALFVPDGLLGPFKELRARRLITEDFDQWQLGVQETDGMFLEVLGPSLEKKLQDSGSKFHFEGCGPECTTQHYSSDKVQRVMLLAAHLLAGALALLNEPSTLMKQAPKRSDGPKWRRSVFEEGRYLLGKDIQVKIDCRDAVRGYVGNPERALRKIRWPVRGHKRWQVCGVQRADRKLIWVQPYWKGEEGLPELVRTHVLQGKSRVS